MLPIRFSAVGNCRSRTQWFVEWEEDGVLYAVDMRYYHEPEYRSQAGLYVCGWSPADADLELLLTRMYDLAHAAGIRPPWFEPIADAA